MLRSAWGAVLRRRGTWTLCKGAEPVASRRWWISSLHRTSPKFGVGGIGRVISNRFIARSSSSAVWIADTSSSNVLLMRQVHSIPSVKESEEELAAPPSRREGVGVGVGAAVSSSAGNTLSFREREWDRRYQQLCRLVEECGGRFPFELTAGDGGSDEGKGSIESKIGGEGGDESDASSLSAAERHQLSRWCRVQRRQYKLLLQKQQEQQQKQPEPAKPKVPYVLSQRRLDKLHEIGFLFEPFASAWDERYRELQEFYRENGHSVVPASYAPNPSLAVWVGEQRYHFKKLREGRPTSMTPERIARLEELDFAWNAYDVLWMRRYGELRQYMVHRGMGRLPSLKNNPVLRRWVDQQRRLYRAKIQDGIKNSLKPERETLLRELGILWDRKSTSKTGTTVATVP